MAALPWLAHVATAHRLFLSPPVATLGDPPASALRQVPMPPSSPFPPLASTKQVLFDLLHRSPRRTPGGTPSGGALLSCLCGTDIADSHMLASKILPGGRSRGPGRQGAARALLMNSFWCVSR